MDKHSEKGLKTLELMGTKPDDWGLVEIKWVQEMRDMPVKKQCPTCYGIGEAHFEQDGSLAINKISSSKNYYDWNDRQKQIMSLPYGKCPTCPTNRRGYGTGEVVTWKPMKVWIGYPQWEAGTKFDSRFGGVNNHCGLCQKHIKASGFVPVHGKDANGQVHAMYIGQDCARKFLGIKKWRKDGTARISERA
jgi:hypothetical protein